MSWPRAADEAATPGPAKDVEPVTTKAPQIALEDLELMLAPMTKDEIAIETKGWFALVQAKEREISVAELNVRRKNREIAQLEKQKTAAAELAKATEDAKAAGGAASKKEKDAAAQRLAEAKKALTKTVEASAQETENEEKKAEATKEAMAKQAEATQPPASATDSGPGVKSVPAVSDKEVLQKAAETAAKKSEGAGDETKVEKVVAAAAKEEATTAQVKSMAQAAPSAAATNAAAPGTADAETSEKAEKLANKVEEAAAAKTDVKVELVDYSTQLTSQRTALVDRLKLVLDKWEQKGGDPKTYRLYLASIGGIKIDVSDQAATWARIRAWLTADEGGLRWARNLAIFVGYILGSIVLAWIVRSILRKVMSRGQLTSQLLRNFVVVSSGRSIVALGILLGLSALEVNLAPLLALIGAAGFVVAFALQGTLSNFASGILIMLFKPFDVGDAVEVGGGIEGKVTNVSIFSTYIHTDDGSQKIVPNDSIWKNAIVNRTTGVVGIPKVTEQKPDDAKPQTG